MRKIKRDDEVVVISGRDKGKRGRVTKIVDDNRAIVGGINIVKKHQRPNPQLGIPGGIIEKEAPIQISNLAIFNPQTKKADRVGFKFEGGKKVRIYKSTGEIVG